MVHGIKGTFISAIVVAFVASCLADIYMHNPRGSNNRLNERSANRNNGNRMFDSQVVLSNKQHVFHHSPCLTRLYMFPFLLISVIIDILQTGVCV